METPCGDYMGGWMVTLCTGRTDAANGWIMCTDCRRRGCGDAIWWFYGWVEGHTTVTDKTPLTGGFLYELVKTTPGGSTGGGWRITLL